MDGSPADCGAFSLIEIIVAEAGPGRNLGEIGWCRRLRSSKNFRHSTSSPSLVRDLALALGPNLKPVLVPALVPVSGQVLVPE